MKEHVPKAHFVGRRRWKKYFYRQKNIRRFDHYDAGCQIIKAKKRTYLNKLTESFRAVQLELHYSKDEILQLYLNLVPYGGNIEGIKAASLYYFGKTPQLLSLAEITALTIVPNRPSSLRPGRRNDALKTARNQWLTRFGKENLFDQNIIRDAISEPLIIRRLSAPKQAPHLALRLKKDFPDQPIISTTIKIQSQNQIEEQRNSDCAEEDLHFSRKGAKRKKNAKTAKS